MPNRDPRNDGSSSIKDLLPPDNDPALGFRESLFSFESESKTMESSTESRDVEEVPTDRLDSHSYSVDDFLDDIDKSRGSPPLRRSACED